MGRVFITVLGLLTLASGGVGILAVQEPPGESTEIVVGFPQLNMGQLTQLQDGLQAALQWALSTPTNGEVLQGLAAAFDMFAYSLGLEPPTLANLLLDLGQAEAEGRFAEEYARLLPQGLERLVAALMTVEGVSEEEANLALRNIGHYAYQLSRALTLESHGQRLSPQAGDPVSIYTTIRAFVSLIESWLSTTSQLAALTNTILEMARSAADAAEIGAVEDALLAVERRLGEAAELALEEEEAARITENIYVIARIGFIHFNPSIPFNRLVLLAALRSFFALGSEGDTDFFALIDHIHKIVERPQGDEEGWYLVGAIRADCYEPLLIGVTSGGREDALPALVFSRGDPERDRYIVAAVRTFSDPEELQWEEQTYFPGQYTLSGVLPPVTVSETLDYVVYWARRVFSEIHDINYPIHIGYDRKRTLHIAAFVLRDEEFVALAQEWAEAPQRLMEEIGEHYFGEEDNNVLYLTWEEEEKIQYVYVGREDDRPAPELEEKLLRTWHGYDPNAEVEVEEYTPALEADADPYALAAELVNIVGGEASYEQGLMMCSVIP